MLLATFKNFPHLCYVPQRKLTSEIIATLPMLSKVGVGLEMNTRTNDALDLYESLHQNLWFGF